MSVFQNNSRTCSVAFAALATVGAVAYGGYKIGFEEHQLPGQYEVTQKYPVSLAHDFTIALVLYPDAERDALETLIEGPAAYLNVSPDLANTISEGNCVMPTVVGMGSRPFPIADLQVHPVTTWTATELDVVQCSDATQQRQAAFEEILNSAQTLD